jgi:hypothetical protein
LKLVFFARSSSSFFSNAIASDQRHNSDIEPFPNPVSRSMNSYHNELQPQPSTLTALHESSQSGKEVSECRNSGSVPRLKT